MMRKLGIDVGSKRIGLAVSDSTNCIACPLLVLERSGRFTELNKIKNVVEEQSIDEIIVGLPLTLSGKEGRQVQEVRAYISRLKSELNIFIREWDERLTTSLVEKALISADVRRAERKENVDKLAATAILQSYLDYQRTKPQGRR